MDDLERLARLYDRYANTRDPFTGDAFQARREFHDMLDDLFRHAGGSEVSRDDFRKEAIRRCRQFLNKNPNV